MNEPKHETLTREEQAFLIKVQWEALQAPSWTRDDIIEFGKAIYAKTALKDLDPKKFNQLFPFLKQITDHLGIKLKEAVLPAPPPTPAVQGESIPAKSPEDAAPSTPELNPLPPT